MKSPAFFVHRLQIDHGLAAVAAFAVDVLEQMQGERLAAVEQQAIALLQVVEIAGRDFPDQPIDGSAARRRHQFFSVQHRGEFRRGVDQRLGRIAQERGQHLERLHQAISIGFLALRGEPNRLVSVSPPEQPLPKVKPQEPRMS